MTLTNTRKTEEGAGLDGKLRAAGILSLRGLQRALHGTHEKKKAELSPEEERKLMGFKETAEIAVTGNGDYRTLGNWNYGQC